jgi:putative transposase
MSHSCVEIYLHVIFSTKGRAPLIPQNMESRLYGYFGGIARERQVPILNINGTSDHLHMLLKLHPTVPVSVLMKELKSYSSSWLKKQGRKDFAWQEGYGAFSCSITHLGAVTKYIENQKEHHKTRTFSDEIEALRKRFGIKWTVDPIESP